jgi:Flp pilus assembly protein TadB
MGQRTITSAARVAGVTVVAMLLALGVAAVVATLLTLAVATIMAVMLMLVGVQPWRRVDRRLRDSNS